MAHISGYGGSITFTAGSKAWGAQVMEWRTYKNHKMLDTPYEGNSNTPRIVGRSDWRAEVDFLADDGFVAADMQTGDAVTIKLNLNGSHYESAAGIIADLQSVSPRDGFHYGRAVIVGNDSILTYT